MTRDTDTLTALREAAEWLVKVHGDDVTLKGTALAEDIDALRAALEATIVPKDAVPAHPENVRTVHSVTGDDEDRGHEHWPKDAVPLDVEERKACPICYSTDIEHAETCPHPVSHRARLATPPTADEEERP